MSSRRKSSTPCMIRVSDVGVEDDSAKMEVTAADDVVENGSATSHLSDHEGTSDSVREDVEDASNEEKKVNESEDTEEKEAKPPRKQQGGGGGYECKYCPFSTQNLNDFKEHVDSTHPNVILNPLYLCAVCNFSTKKFDSLTEHNESRHPGENNFKFKRIKLNNQTVLEQTIEGVNNSDVRDVTDTQGGDGYATFPLSKSSTVKVGKTKIDGTQLFSNGNGLDRHLENLIPKDQITAVSVNGTFIIPDPMTLQGLSHVMPLLQRPPNFNCVPKIAVPLNTTKYNPLLDNNPTLMTSFNKFPYPTHAELSWLTAASKHPEEQIKVWFTTQRLKQGITWSPDEVEEARKKMFNGSIPPAHQTFTVLPASLSQPAKTAQPFPQIVSCHILGQSRQVLTSTANGLTVTCTPVAVTTANHVQALKRPLATSSMAPEVKRPMMVPSEDPKEKLRMAPPPVPPPLERLPMAPPPVPPEIKRSMAPPLVAPEMKRPITAPPVSPKGKLPMALPLLPPKDKLAMAPPLLFPKDRLPMTPIVSNELKRAMVAPQIRSHIASLPALPKDKLSLPHLLLVPDLQLPVAHPLVAPPVKRPTIIQAVRAPIKAPSLVPTFSLECKNTEPQTTELKGSRVEGQLSEGKEANGVSRGDVKNWFCDQGTHTRNGTLHLNNDFVPKERPKTVPTHFPLLERVKGKTADQLKILEESFQRNSFPTYNEVDRLVNATRLSREEIDSWFLERRALRDNLEQALLNSMGAKRMDAVEKRLQQKQQHGALNGVHKPGGLPMGTLLPIIAPTTCPVPLDGKTLTLLKDVFVQTRWPSPEEYSRLELQTGLARTDIVRWFKDSRLALRSGTLDWIELFHTLNSSEQNGQGGAQLSTEHGSSLIQRCQEGKAPRMEGTGGMRDCAKLSSQEIKDWFANKLGHSMPDVSKNRGQNGGGREDCGSWAEDAVGVKAGVVAAAAQGWSQTLIRGTEEASGGGTG